MMKKLATSRDGESHECTLQNLLNEIPISAIGSVVWLCSAVC